MLVDDRPENLLALEAILEPLGQELVRVESGEEALRRLLHDEYAVILLDVQMPGMDGFQTAELIKKLERTRHIPIVFLTAISKDAEHVFQGYGAGAVDYLMKPFDPHILRAKVSVFIDLWQKTVEIRRQDELLKAQEIAALERESELRYRSLADAVPQIVWTTDADGKTLSYNERWYEYTGLKRGQKSDAQAIVHPDDVPEMLERWEISRATGDPFEVEYRFRRADGVYRWHLGRSVCLRDDSSAITGWVGTATDIHDRRLAEERQRFLAEAGWVLGSSLDYEQTLADVARLAVPHVADWCTVDIFVDGKLERLALEHVDPLKLALARELQETMLAATGAAGAGAIRDREAVLVRDIDEEALASFGFDESQLEIARALAPRSYVTVPLVARGEVFGSISFVTAESERRYDESDLALAEELARHAAAAIDNARLYAEAERRGRASRALEAVGDGVVLVDREGIIRLWNTAAATITGLPESDVLGKPIADVVKGWNEISPRIPVASKPGELVHAETVPVEFDGRELWISGSGVGFEEGTVYAFRDLTEERALEEIKAEFVATVSHELRTPLAAIYGSAQTLRRTDIELDPEIQVQLLGVIASESDRLGTIVNDLLVAGSLDADQLPISVERCDPAELAGSVVEAARTHLPESIELQLNAPKRLLRVVADPVQLHQVLVNLVDNAVKYSPAGGEVAVGGGERRRSDPFLGDRQGPRNSILGAPSNLREVLPSRPRHDPRHRRHRPRPLHLPRARPEDGREDLGRVGARQGIDVRRRATGRGGEKAGEEVAREVRLSHVRRQRHRRSETTLARLRDESDTGD